MLPNYKRNRIILASVTGVAAIAIGVIAVLASDDDPRDRQRSTTTTRPAWMDFPTTTVPKATSSTRPVEELLEELERDSEPSLMTLSRYESIENGMREDSFLAVVGSNCVKSVESSAGVIYQCDGWGGPGANAIFQFQNGQLVTKAQHGLKD
jgi:hypothetical protein